MKNMPLATFLMSFLTPSTVTNFQPEGAGPVGRRTMNSLPLDPVAAAIVAADTAAKTADVELIELRLARGMCGKSYLLLTGEVAAVTAAIEKAKAEAGEEGMFLDSSVIAGPDKKIWDKIL